MPSLGKALSKIFSGYLFDFTITLDDEALSMEEKALQRCYSSFGNIFIVKIVGNVFIVIYSFFLSRHTDIKVRSNTW